MWAQQQQAVAPPQQISQGQQIGQGQPQQIVPTTVMVPVPVQATGKYDSFAARASAWLGGLLIGFGVLMIILNAIDIKFADIFGFFGQGILAGIFFILTGSFALCSAKYKTTCPIVTTLVLAILGSLAAVPAIALHTLGAVNASGSFFSGEREDEDAVRGLNSTLVALAILGGFFSIVCSALTCAALGRGRSYQQAALVTIPMQNVGTTGVSQPYYAAVPQQPAAVSTGPPPYSEKM